MSNTVYLLWFCMEMPEGQADVECLIGVYSSESEARQAIDRVKNAAGFRDFPQGFEICPYELNHDHWTEGYVMQSVTDSDDPMTR